ncbi:MAG: ABC transporter permease subunit [Ruminococcus sp.]|nr:ABC transporter permease subunit [Ruminococcus sp.]
MLKIYWNELKKMKRKKVTMTLFAIGFLLPAFSVLLCVHSHYRFRNLVGMNEMFGSFLLVPFLFSVQLLSLFEMEEQNQTLKNILIIGIPKEKIFLSKLLASLTIVLLFIAVNTIYTMIGGLFLKNYTADFLLIFEKLFMTSAAAVGATFPVTVLIVLLRKKNLVAMISVNCFVLLEFLLVWQLSMFHCLGLHLPILIAYRITYPIGIFDYTENLQLGLDTLYYPADKGILILVFTVMISFAVSMWIYRSQEI